MATKIIKQEKNIFLEREEIIIEFSSDVAPSSEEVKVAIGKNIDLTVVKNIKGQFGKKVFVAEAVVYDNTEAKKKIETIPKKIRKKIEADKKAEEVAKKKAEEEAKKAEEEAEKVEEADPEAEVTEAEAPIEEAKTEEKTE
ncbi:hypothetical protein KAI32_02520 [Candidatus Pacearchaeota archaeon]|nr:hypothetical protein [Candidatus Pacearchaeota archaeon]